MKFSCDSCGSQYMISDEKVRPSGVKVRCKKCGNVVVVRRAAEPPADPPAAAAPANGAGSGNGLDAELGLAFDSAFGGAPPEAPAPDVAAPQPAGGEDQTPAASSAPASAPAATEWYVAIGQAQVGPLPLAEVKRKWEGGDVGPDSLVWRPGMGDWQPLSSVGDLAGQLAPMPRASSSAQSARAEAAPRTEPRAAAEQLASATAAATTAATDVAWKPVGASALATLASEEIAARNAPAPAPAAAGGKGADGARSLVDALPDGGGVDPTGAIPLPIKGLETTGEKKIERRSSVASRAEETRHKRSITRAVVIGVVVVVAVVGGAAAYVLSQMKKLGPSPAAVAVAPVPLPPPPAAAAPAPTPPAGPAAPVTPPAEVAAAPAQQAAVAPPEAAPPVVAPPAPVAKAPERPRRVAKAEPVRATRKPPAVQAAAPVEEKRPPAPAPAPARKKDALLDFDSKDSALDEALGGGGSGRSVYVPPARAADLPEKLSPSQINESVAGRIDALRKCVSDQKSRDPGASGVLKLRWIIGGDGNVRDVKTLTSEYATSPFAHCITGVVKTIRFPRSATTGQEVTFPFSF